LSKWHSTDRVPGRSVIRTVGIEVLEPTDTGESRAALPEELGTNRANAGWVCSQRRREPVVLADSPVRGAPGLGLALAVALWSFTVLTGGACAHPTFFPGTTILKNDDTEKLVDTIELYRKRLTERDVEGLLVLASEKYREDSGTPRSDDDYGYDGLKDILRHRLGGLRSLWYEIEFRDIRVHDQVADVDVFLNGSFELASQSSGDRYRRVNDYHRFVLERQGDAWKFLSGM
jgi:hypothetical protein